jgi:hypothetical protein
VETGAIIVCVVGGGGGVVVVGVGGGGSGAVIAILGCFGGRIVSPTGQIHVRRLISSFAVYTMLALSSRQDESENHGKHSRPVVFVSYPSTLYRMSRPA